MGNKIQMHQLVTFVEKKQAIIVILNCFREIIWQSTIGKPESQGRLYESI